MTPKKRLEEKEKRGAIIVRKERKKGFWKWILDYLVTIILVAGTILFCMGFIWILIAIGLVIENFETIGLLMLIPFALHFLYWYYQTSEDIHGI